MDNSSDAFVRLLEEHRKILFKVANAYCRDVSAREDLISEIIAQLWRAFPKYDSGYRFSTWMYRISLNVAISFHRSELRRGALIGSADDAMLASIPAVDGHVDLDDDLAALHEAIRSLGELDRALVILYLDGNRYDTIASILGISETNVATKLSRIKHRLRREIEMRNAQGAQS